MTRAEAEAILRGIAQNRAEVRVTRHFWNRVRERVPGFGPSHLYRIVRDGDVVGWPEWSTVYRTETVTVRCRLPEFGDVQVVMAISSAKEVTCVTIYRTER